jgi:hypothetical protein
MADRRFNEGQEVEVYENGTWRPGIFREYRNGNLLVDVIVSTTRPSIRREFSEHYVRRLERRPDWHFLDSDQDSDMNPSGTDDDDIDERPQVATRRQPLGVAFEVHEAFPELNFKKFMTIIRKDNNGASNFKDPTYPLQPLITYINRSTTLDAKEKTSLTSDLNIKIKPRLNMYLSEHSKSKNSVMEMIQFIMSQGPNYKDPYIRFLVFDCVNAYGPGGASCTKGVFERVFLINKSVLITLCSDDTSSSSASSRSTCKEVYRELLSCFQPDIDINDMFQKWYNQFSYDAIPEEENPLKNLSLDARKKHFRNFVRQDERMTRRIWTNEEFQEKLEKLIKTNEKIFQTLDAAVIGGRRKRSKRLTKKRQSKRLRKTIKRRKSVKK